MWVVFHQLDVGKLYRFEHRHLLQDFNPGHPLAIQYYLSEEILKQTLEMLNI